MTLELPEVRVGFIPLVDCAPVVVAHELGFAEQEGIRLRLVRETSWATIRDRLAVAHLDAAHLLAPMSIAGNLGLGPLPVAIQVPIALGTGANTITVSRELAKALESRLPPGELDAGRALEAMRYIHDRKALGDGRPFVFGVVHPYSAHYYELKYWLSAGGFVEGRDYELVVVPPSLLPDALKTGRIDGFCAGEPWGTVGVLEAGGRIITTNAHIWRNGPEKVLGVRWAWAEQNPEPQAALLRAIYRAAEWCDREENSEQLAALLSSQVYLDQPLQRLRPVVAGMLPVEDGAPRRVDGMLNYSRNAATFPWISHALWFYAQMVRNAQVIHSQAALLAARATYRPKTYRDALGLIGVEVPRADSKIEGTMQTGTPVGSRKGALELGPDTFFDGRIFDPDRVDAYLAGNLLASP